MDQSPASTLFLVAESGQRQALSRRLRELGVHVLAEYGDVAVEGLATPRQVATVRADGVVAVHGVVGREHLESLPTSTALVVRVWNQRFTASVRDARRQRGRDQQSWGREDRDPPGAGSLIAPEDFVSMLERAAADEPPLLDLAREGDEQITPMTPRELIATERRLARRYDSETLGYHLARLARLLDERHRRLLMRLPESVLDRLWQLVDPEDCWRMTGEQSVGVVLVESSRRDGPRFDSTERADLLSEIVTGLNWLAAIHPGHDLRWVYDVQETSIDVADGTDSSTEAYWRDPAMAQVSYHGRTYPPSWSAVGDYREDMRVHERSAHAFVVFVTPYGTDWHAYASGGRITLARRHDWGGWGRDELDVITAHEASHLYGAADEYTGSGTPCSSCASVHGCDQVPNGNCGACADPRESCAMEGSTRRLCSWSRGQIGWSHLFVELRTADESWAGTDDDVVLDIGDHTFPLDTGDVDDRERGDVQGYAIWAPWLRREDIKRVLLRKSPDGSAGGWKLARVRVWFRGELVCDRSPDQWLEDDHLTFVGCVFDRDYVNTLRVRISTADVAWAGTDDDVSVTLAGRSWNLDNPGRDDFERGRTDSFDLDPGTGLRRSSIRSVRVDKTPDGISGGWKLGGVQVSTNGSALYDDQDIDRWLEDDSRTWVAPV